MDGIPHVMRKSVAQWQEQRDDSPPIVDRVKSGKETLLLQKGYVGSEKKKNILL
jgi:hypothetical protein